MQGSKGGRGKLTFYFYGKGEEEDLTSKSEDDLDFSEDEWGKEAKRGRMRIRRRR